MKKLHRRQDSHDTISTSMLSVTRQAGRKPVLVWKRRTSSLQGTYKRDTNGYT